MNYFVFVVCGAKEHIETLNYSLKFLKHFSKFPILIVTDESRNEVPINHDSIINIKTSDSFDHHQASIYLKTGLFKFLDMNQDNTYCYLDSDVVAISESINSIFDQYSSPIVFAPDHCSFDKFSPHAMNCNCLSETIRLNNEYRVVDDFFKQDVFNLAYNENDRTTLKNLFSEIGNPSIKSFAKSLIYLLKRYILPIKKIRFGSFTFNKKTHLWNNSKNEFIDYDFNYYANELKKKTGLKFHPKTSIWYNKNGENIIPKTPECSHLREHIKNKFKIDIPSDWHHWNGGVYLFNNTSVEFLKFWHKITIEEFEDSKSKTRDQGTLAVSVWKWGLQNSILLDKKYNFITEFDNSNISHSVELGFTEDGFQSTFKPCFLHIYHEWGHKGWSVWDFVENLSEELAQTDTSFR